MAAPRIHSISSSKRYGGIPEDYDDIHILMDSTKASFPDNRHRTITHNSWFSQTIIPKIFGHQRINSSGRTYNTKDIAEQHILEDYRNKFIPSIQDYLENMTLESWMNNGMGESPNSRKAIPLREERSSVITIEDFSRDQSKKSKEYID